MILQIDRFIIVPATIIFWVLIPIAIFFGMERCKITEHNSSKFKFIFRPIVRLTLASFLAGTGAILSLVLLFHNYSVDLTCNKVAEVKTDIQCNLSTKGILIRHQNQFISDLRGAKLNIRENKKEGSQTSTPILVTSEVEINLIGLFGGSDIIKTKKIVDDINQFINSSEPELRIAKNESEFLAPFLWILSFLFVLAFFIVALSSSRYFSFDSETQEFILGLKSFIRETVLATSALQEIEEVKVEISEEDSFVRRVVLYSKASQQLSITGTYNKYRYHNSLAKKISKFLKNSDHKNNKDN